jgi:hypothetical protein
MSDYNEQDHIDEFCRLAAIGLLDFDNPQVTTELLEAVGPDMAEKCVQFAKKLVHGTRRTPRWDIDTIRHINVNVIGMYDEMYDAQDDPSPTAMTKHQNLGALKALYAVMRLLSEMVNEYDDA